VVILSPRISDKPELAPHSPICKLIPGRRSCFVIVGPQVAVYQLSRQPCILAIASLMDQLTKNGLGIMRLTAEIRQCSQLSCLLP